MTKISGIASTVTTVVSTDLCEKESAGGTSQQITAANLAKGLRNLGLQGARVRMTADDTAQNVTTQTAISFDSASDLDTSSFWSAGSPTRLTIPAGISYVSLVGQVHITSTTADTWLILAIVQRNSSNTIQRIFVNRFVEMGFTTKVLSVASGIVPVSSGDYFTLEVREESDTSVTIEGDDTIQTFLSLKVEG